MAYAHEVQTLYLVTMNCFFSGNLLVADGLKVLIRVRLESAEIKEIILGEIIYTVNKNANADLSMPRTLLCAGRSQQRALKEVIGHIVADCAAKHHFRHAGHNSLGEKRPCQRDTTLQHRKMSTNVAF